MKYIVASLVLLMGTSLVGCSALVENNYIKDLPTLTPITIQKESDFITIKPALYFQDLRTLRLSVETRELTVPAGKRPEEIIISAMLEGPESQNLLPFGPSIALERVEVSEDISNVYLTSMEEHMDEHKFLLATAISDTLIDYTGVSYVCIFINGDILTIGGQPCGALSKSDGNIDNRYKEYRGKYDPIYMMEESARLKIPVVMYFISSGLLLPESRDVEFTYLEQGAGNVLKKVMNELAVGPLYKYNLMSCFRRDYDVFNNVRTAYSEQSRKLTLAFEGEPFIDVPLDQCLAVIYYTVVGIIPSVSSVEVKTDSQYGFMDREHAGEYLGESISLALPTENSLYRELRTVKQSTAKSLETYLHELLRDDEGNYSYAVFGEDISVEDILDVSVEGSVATVNLTRRALNLDRMSIYSIINTLCGVDGIRAVRFLADGNTVEKVGDIDLRYPIMSNPGIEK